MSHITHLNVSGLAGHKQEFERTLHRHVNVFFGPNGSGKTSLLKLIDSAMANRASLVKDVPFEKAEFTIYTRDYNTTFTRSLVSSAVQEASPQQTLLTTDMRPPADVSNEKKWVTAPDEERLQGPYRRRFLPINRLMISQLEQSSYMRYPGADLEDELNQQFAKTVTDLWRSYASSVNARVAKVQQSGLAKIFENTLLGSEPLFLDQAPKDPKTAYERLSTFLNRSQGFRSILPSFEVFSERYAREPRLQSMANEILEVEKLVEAAMKPRHELQRLLQQMFSKNKKIAFSDTEIDIAVSEQLRIHLGSLSSGEKQLIKLFVETLLAEDNTILIDEPELSMHIDWQRALLNSMRELNPLVQIIVATHSPEIMAEIPDEDIFEI
jgi:predicted ATP-dependent endonuclease of OLD family